VIRDEDVLFMYNREKSVGSETKAGHMTLSSKAFFDIMQKNRLIGEVAPIRQIKMAMEGFVW
jgi:hypothetical protein